jgi:aerobic-type carbon monoxide dehydrogenase small subunit (CoxS/CutS family)
MQLHVNGSRHDVELAGHETLLDVLRDRLGLTGAKLSCGRGECGACTVLMQENGATHPVYACITLAAGCADARITTIEGLGTDGLHPLQEAFIAQDAVQCGYCTPGQILAAAALLSVNPAPDEPAIRSALSGNLCRCGTYPRIVLAVQEAAQRMRAGTPR